MIVSVSVLRMSI